MKKKKTLKYNKTGKKKKTLKYNKTGKKRIKVIKGGDGLQTEWLGITNKYNPTNFGWLNKSFMFPCNK